MSDAPDKAGGAGPQAGAELAAEADRLVASGKALAAFRLLLSAENDENAAAAVFRMRNSWPIFSGSAMVRASKECPGAMPFYMNILYMLPADLAFFSYKQTFGLVPRARAYFAQHFMEMPACALRALAWKDESFYTSCAGVVASKKKVREAVASSVESLNNGHSAGSSCTYPIPGDIPSSAKMFIPDILQPGAFNELTPAGAAALVHWLLNSVYLANDAYSIPPAMQKFARPKINILFEQFILRLVAGDFAGIGRARFVKIFRECARPAPGSCVLKFASDRVRLMLNIEKSRAADMAEAGSSFPEIAISCDLEGGGVGRNDLVFMLLFGAGGKLFEDAAHSIPRARLEEILPGASGLAGELSKMA